MFNVRLAGRNLYGKQLFTWLSLVVSLMASFVLSFFPLDVLDEICDLIESVSEGFLTYSSITYIFSVFIAYIVSLSLFYRFHMLILLNGRKSESHPSSIQQTHGKSRFFERYGEFYSRFFNCIGEHFNFSLD